MNSNEYLIKLADELGEPVLNQPAGSVLEDLSHYVIDESTRYQFR